jgi:hypothetical protein
VISGTIAQVDLSPVYQPPSKAYLVGILNQIRGANRRATLASNLFNEVAAALEERERVSSQRHGDALDVTALRVKYARSGNTDLADADRQYKFWAGEVDRLTSVLLAEDAAKRLLEEW